MRQWETGRSIISDPIPSREPRIGGNCRAWSGTRRGHGRHHGRDHGRGLSCRASPHPTGRRGRLRLAISRGKSREDRASGGMSPGRREARSRCMSIPAPCPLRPQASGHRGIGASERRGVGVGASLSGFNTGGIQREEHHGFAIPTGGSGRTRGAASSICWSDGVHPHAPSRTATETFSEA
jgi:hypothetical protein